MNKESTCKFIESQMVRVARLSKGDKENARLAGRILGLRQAEFYRIAIIEKTQSVLSSIDNQAQPKASPEQKPEGASFLSEEGNDGNQ